MFLSGRLRTNEVSDFVTPTVHERDPLGDSNTSCVTFAYKPGESQHGQIVIQERIFFFRTCCDPLSSYGSAAREPSVTASSSMALSSALYLD